MDEQSESEPGPRRRDERGRSGRDARPDRRAARPADGAGRDRRPSDGGADQRRRRPDGDRTPVDGARRSRGRGAAPEGARPRRDGRPQHDSPRSGGWTPGRRSAERGGRVPGSDRPARDGRPGAAGRADGERRSARHVDEPVLPDAVAPQDLDRAARAELRTLSKENADAVARHLVMAARLIEEDAAEAHRHALAAARRAGRVAVVRESVAITAYAVGDFALALRELRTFRRISGSDDQIGLMVDSERGMGRPDRALELGRSVDRAALPVEAQVALAIAMSGARLDQDDARGALDELERVPADLQRVHPWSPTLFTSLSAVHEDLGDADAAALWQRRAERAESLLDEVGEEGAEVAVTSEAVEAGSGDDASVHDEPADPPVAAPSPDGASVGRDPDAGD